MLFQNWQLQSYVGKNAECDVTWLRMTAGNIDHPAKGQNTFVATRAILSKIYPK